VALQLKSDQGATLRAIGQYQGKQELFAHQTPEILDSLRQIAMVESTVSSNRIEGVTAPRERIEGLVLHNTAPQDRSEQEIAGYRDALALIHESAQHMEFSTNIIRQLHSTVFRYVPIAAGDWKAVNNEIVERNLDGSIERIRFTPTTAGETPEAMESLCNRYNEAVNVHQEEPLVMIPLAVLDFLCIHPFLDGNGRVARLLTLLLLYHFNYQVGRYISLERIFEESKETYYETLQASSRRWHDGQHDVAPWMNYFWGVLLRGYREFEERVGAIRTTRGSKTEQVRNAVGRRLGPFAISDIEGDCPGVSRDMIRVVLNQMREEGAIGLEGRGRAAKWKERTANGR
jgi:Fic family protein